MPSLPHLHADMVFGTRLTGPPLQLIGPFFQKFFDHDLQKSVIDFQEMEIEKKTLRSAIRKELAPPGPETSLAIRTRLTALDCWRTARTIFSYHPLKDEVNLLPLLEEQRTKEWIFPRINGESLSLHRWTPDAPWLKGSFDIHEPDPAHWAEVDIETIDLVLIPGIAFDRSGGRLGRGKGFYDRLLSSQGFRAIKIGIVSELCLFQKIPTESHDIRMDLVITESGIYYPSSSPEVSGLDNGTERE
jgi:5-formyltetrahydrofolate cyclo-ligase